MHRILKNTSTWRTTVLQLVQQSRKVSYLEVERKFVPSLDFARNMNALMDRHNADTNTVGQPRWRTDRTLRIRDTYYDVGDQLADKGIWIRFRRSSSEQHDVIGPGSAACSSWDAKIRLGGNFLDSEFLEVQGEEQMRDLLSKHLPHVALEDLEVRADLETTRKSWTLSHSSEAIEEFEGSGEQKQRLSIVMDRVVMAKSEAQGDDSGFVHEVGEIELTRPSILKAVQHTEIKRPELERMRSYIKHFMVHHPELFSDVTPTGKLSAYFDWSRRVE